MRKIAIVNLSTMDGEDFDILERGDSGHGILKPGETLVIGEPLDIADLVILQTGPDEPALIETPTIQAGQRQDVKVIPVLDVFFVREQKPEQFERGQK